MYPLASRSLHTSRGAMLTCAEVAQRLHVSTQFVRDEIRAGHLPALRLGERAIRIPKVVLVRYIEQAAIKALDKRSRES